MSTEAAASWLIRGRPRMTLAAAAATALSSLVVAPLLMDLSWLPVTVLAILVVGAVGFACRAWSVPVPLHPVAQAVALLTVVAWMFVHDATALGVFPGPQVVSDLRELAHGGLLDAATYVAPAPVTDGLLLLVVGGIGLVALAVDTIAVSLHQPALAGIPLGAVYVVPAVTIRGGVPWWLFPFAAAGWLLLLAVDERDRVLSWGRLLGGGQPVTRAGTAGPRAHPRAPKPHLSAVGATGRRLGVAALAAAVLLPALIPGLTEPIFGTGKGAATSSGGGAPDSGPITVDPFVSLRRDITAANDREVIRYYTDDPDPSYLRLATLEVFDGTTWRAADPTDVVRQPLAQPLGSPQLDAIADQRRASYNIAIGELDQTQLPLPYPALSVSAEGDSRSLLAGGWNWDARTRTVENPDGSTQGLRYQVAAIDVRATEAELRGLPSGYPQQLQRLTVVPDSVPESVIALARKITADATSPYEKAKALQRYFTRTGGFTYSTSVRSGNDASYLEEFLRDKVGYCEQFAAAFAIMARVVGIPSRVDVGFTRGTQRPDGTWSVTVRDAHAWPELWLQGAGWVYFEPTPRADSATAGVVQPDYADTTNEVDTTPSTQQVPTDPEARRGLKAADEAAVSAMLDQLARDGATGDEDAWRWRTLLGLLALVCLLALVPWVIRFGRRRRRLRASLPPAALAEGGWAELRDTARDYDLPWSDADTPRTNARRLLAAARLGGEPAGALGRIVRRVERVRYGRPDSASGRPPSDVAADRAGLLADLGTVREAIAGQVRVRARLRALLLPRSVVRRGERGFDARLPGGLPATGGGDGETLHEPAAAVGGDLVGTGSGAAATRS